MTITEAIDTTFNVVSRTISLIQQTPLFMLFAASGVVSIGIGVVKKLIGRY